VRKMIDLEKCCVSCCNVFINLYAYCISFLTDSICITNENTQCTIAHVQECVENFPTMHVFVIDFYFFVQNNKHKSDLCDLI